MRLRKWIVAVALSAACGGSSETAPPPASGADGAATEPIAPTVTPTPAPAPTAPDGGAASTPASPAPGRVRTELGARTVAILQGAASVEFARLDHRDTRAADARGVWPANRMAAYRIRGTLRPVDAALAAELVALLLDDASYEWQLERRCARRQIVGYRFHAGDEVADVVLGMSCEQVEIVSVGSEGTRLVDWAGWYTPANDRVVALVERTTAGPPAQGR